MAGNLISWSAEQLRIHGLDEATAPRAFEDFVAAVHPDDRDRVVAECERLLAGGEPFSFEYRIVRPDGAVRLLHALGQVVPDDAGAPLRMVGTSRDVTERRRTEDALRASEARFRTMFEQFPASVMRFGPGGEVREVNRAYVDFWGLTMQDLAEWSVFDDPQLASVRDEVRRGFAGETVFLSPVLYDTRLFGPAARADAAGPRWVGAFMFPVRDERGEVSDVFMVHSDITETRAAEEALRASEESYRTIFDASNDAIFVHDLETGAVLDANRTACERSGVTPDELRAGGMDIIGNGPPPFTPERGLEYLRRAATGEPQRFEWMSIHRETGEEVWVEVSLQRVAIRGTDRLLALVRDIRERKLAERALRESEESYRTIFHHSSDAIWVHDLETGAFLDVNQRACEMYGYTVEETRALGVEGLSWGEPPFTIEEAREFMLRAAAGEPQRFEWLGRHKDDSPVWGEVQLRRVTIRGEDRMLATARDIADRKRAEELLRRQNEELEARVAERTAELAATNEALEEEVAEHEAAKQELVDRTQELEGIFQALPDLYFRMHGDGVIEDFRAGSGVLAAPAGGAPGAAHAGRAPAGGGRAGGGGAGGGPAHRGAGVHGVRAAAGRGDAGLRGARAPPGRRAADRGGARHHRGEGGGARPGGARGALPRPHRERPGPHRHPGRGRGQHLHEPLGAAGDRVGAGGPGGAQLAGDDPPGRPPRGGAAAAGGRGPPRHPHPPGVPLPPPGRALDRAGGGGQGAAPGVGGGGLRLQHPRRHRPPPRGGGAAAERGALPRPDRERARPDLHPGPGREHGVPEPAHAAHPGDRPGGADGAQRLRLHPPRRPGAGGGGAGAHPAGAGAHRLRGVPLPPRGRELAPAGSVRAAAEPRRPGGGGGGQRPRRHRAEGGGGGAGAGKGGGGGGQPRQERVPVADEPRAAHPAEQHPGLRAGAGPGGDGAGAPEVAPAHPARRAAPAAADQRGAGDRAHRGGAAEPVAGAGAHRRGADGGGGAGAPPGGAAAGDAGGRPARLRRRVRARRPAAAHAGAPQPAHQRHQVQPAGRPGAPGLRLHPGGRRRGAAPGRAGGGHRPRHPRRPRGAALHPLRPPGRRADGDRGDGAGPRPVAAAHGGDGRGADAGGQRPGGEHLPAGAALGGRPAGAGGGGPPRRRRGARGARPGHAAVRGGQPGQPEPGGDHPAVAAGVADGPGAPGAAGRGAGARAPAGPGAAGPPPPRHPRRGGAAPPARRRAHRGHPGGGDQRGRHARHGGPAARRGRRRLPDQAAGHRRVPGGGGALPPGGGR